MNKGRLMLTLALLLGLVLLQGLNPMAYAQTPTPQPRATPIASGGLLKGEIKLPGQMDWYTFEGKAGETVVIRIVWESGDLRPAVELFGPKGEKLAQDSDGRVARIDLTLKDTGIHTVMELSGTIAYGQPVEYASTQIRATQTSVKGSTTGDYALPLNAVVTHVQVTDKSSPYEGEGFSIVSFTSDSGSGEGWAYAKAVSDKVVQLDGLFTAPLLGIVSGKLDWSTSTPTLSLTTQRVDLGSSAAALSVKIWGPKRVSPGQTVDYIIEYRNDGIKAAEESVVFDVLDSSVEFVSASSNASYDEDFRYISWDLGTVPPKAVGVVAFQAKIPSPLPQGTTLVTSAYVVNIEGSGGSPNLFVNGIGLKVGSVGAKKYPEFARSMQADWVPAYNTGYLLTDIANVQYATPEDLDNPRVTPTPSNGLTRSEVTNRSYDTCYGYSGGTRTLVSAIRYSKLICNKVILISPISGVQKRGTYRKEIGDLLQRRGVKTIEIYQSSKDKLPFGNVYQAYFDRDDALRSRDGIQIYDIPLSGWAGINAHWELFLAVNERFKGKQGTSSPASSVVAVAHDPNILYGPSGNVSPGQKLTYKVEYENEGEGIAFGVYFTDTLPKDLDDSTLQIGPVKSTKDNSVIAPAGTYNRDNRTITWLVGEVGPKTGGYSEFSVNVGGDAPHGAEIINYGTVYFPSVPETTRTNGIVSLVNVPGQAVTPTPVVTPTPIRVTPTPVVTSTPAVAPSPVATPTAVGITPTRVITPTPVVTSTPVVTPTPPAKSGVWSWLADGGWVWFAGGGLAAVVVALTGILRLRRKQHGR